MLLFLLHPQSYDCIQNKEKKRKEKLLETTYDFIETNQFFILKLQFLFVDSNFLIFAKKHFHADVKV